MSGSQHGSGTTAALPPASADSSGSPSGTFLSLPPDVLALIACKLEYAEDRVCLAATCRTLRAASRGGGVHGSSTWWGGPRLVASLGRARAQAGQQWGEAWEEEAAQATRWLASCRPSAQRLAITGYDSEVQVVAPSLPAPPLEGVRELELNFFYISRRSWVSLACQTQLTRLAVLSSFVQGPCTPALRALPGLQRLIVSAARDDEGMPCTPPFCRDLAGCSRLTALVMDGCGMDDFPAGLSTLSSLQRLSLAEFYLPDTRRWHELAALPHLTQLALSKCKLVAVPPVLSRLTGLRELSLQANWDLASGWAHLSTLRALTVLDLSFLRLTHLPSVLSALTALRKLNLYSCARLGEGDGAWQPLSSHPFLRHLNTPTARQLATNRMVWLNEIDITRMLCEPEY